MMDGHELAEIERTAVELATLAGARITTARGRTLAVRYKSEVGAAEEYRDPVSEIDHEVEVLIRARVAERFAGHDILGEESEERPGRDHDVVWAVDPIDGTTNFVNGFPLFAASIGVLDAGRPVAGAVWCSTSHALRAGVYHARKGGPLRFESEAMTPNLNPAVRRRLAGLGSGWESGGLPWDTRKTGSAAIECAFVAAGLLGVARFDRPNVWDVAGGLALVQAAGGEVRVRGAQRWEAFGVFEPAAKGEGAPDLRHWNRPMIIGEDEAVARMCQDNG